MRAQLPKKYVTDLFYTRESNEVVANVGVNWLAANNMGHIRYVCDYIIEYSERAIAETV